MRSLPSSSIVDEVDAWLAAGADAQSDAYAVDATMHRMLKQSAPQQPAQRNDGFQRSIDKMRREIAILQIVMLTGMNYREAEDYLKRRGEQ